MMRRYPELSGLGPSEDAMLLALKMEEEANDCNERNMRNATLS